MKLNGEKIQGPNVVTIVIPRGDRELVFKAQAILDYDRFDKLCPIPTPPSIRRAGKKQSEPDFKDKSYTARMEEYWERRMHYIFIESLRATPGFEWETVNYDNPDTWKNYEKEMQDSGFSPSEKNYIFKQVMIANSLNEEKLEEARNRFLAAQLEPQLNGTSPMDGQQNSPSGEPVSVLE